MTAACVHSSRESVCGRGPDSEAPTSWMKLEESIPPSGELRYSSDLQPRVDFTQASTEATSARESAPAKRFPGQYSGRCGKPSCHSWCSRLRRATARALGRRLSLIQ